MARRGRAGQAARAGCARDGIAEAVGARGPATAGPNLSRLQALIAEHNLTDQQQAAWCSHFKVDRLDHLTQQQVDAIVAKIERSVTKGA